MAATELERLVVSLQGDIKSFDNAMKKAVGINARYLREIEQRQQKASKVIASIWSGARLGGIGLGAIGGALAIGELTKTVDAYNRIANSLRSLGIEGDRTAKTQDEIVRIAMRSRAPLEAVGGLYSRLLVSTKDLGATQADVAKATETISKGFQISGATASEAAAASTQLSQAFASGVLRGEEFNSIMENAPPIARAIAKEFGVTVGELRQMAEAGELVSSRVFQAIIKSAPDIEKAFGKSIPTVEQSVTNLQTAFTALVGRMDETVGLSARVASGMNKIAEAMDNVSAKDSLAKAVADLRATEQALTGAPVARNRLGQPMGGGSPAVGRQQTELQNRLEVQRKKVERLVVQRIDDVADAAIKEYQKGIEGVDFGSGISVPGTPRPMSRPDIGAMGDLDKTIEGYVDRVVGAESGGNRFARNPNSTATGVGQFIESTWIRLFKQNFPDRAEGLSREMMLAYRTDTNVSRELIKQYARENADVLQAAGVSVNEAALQLSHFLGAGDAAKVLSAAPGTPLAGLISSASIAANPSILGFGKTVDDARAYAERRAGMDTPGARGVEGRENFGYALQQQQAYIQMLREETEVRAALNPLIDDDGRALSTLEAAQRLLNAAQEEGVAAGRELSSVQQLLYGDLSTLTPEARRQAEAMRELATATGQTEAARNAVERNKEGIRSAAYDIRDTTKDVLGGFISDLRDGVSATEALGNALDRLADRLIDSALDSLLDGIFGSATGKGGGGIFGKLFGFASGGYTGPGGKYQPKGIVHANEVVWSQEDVRRAGGVGAVEAMRRGMRGYADGGVVGGLTMPRISDATAMRGSVPVDISVSVDNNGNLQAYVNSVAERASSRAAGAVMKQVPRVSVTAMRQTQLRGTRP